MWGRDCNSNSTANCYAHSYRNTDCYSYGNCQGDEGHLLGTAEEVGTELSRVLQGLTRADVATMRHDTSRFFIELLIELPQPG